MVAIVSEVFRWVDEETGACITLLSQKMRKWCLRNADQLHVHYVAVEERQARIIADSDAIIPDRVQALTETERREPLIYIRFGNDEPPTVVLADGRHRYIRAATEGDKIIATYILEEHQWRPFEVEGGTLTQEELRAHPVGHLPRRP